MHPSTERRGFTLIESLVVVAIVGVLIGLLLPLVSMVRTRARILDTEHRMQQVQQALATHGGGSAGSAAASLRRVADLGAGFQLLDVAAIKRFIGTPEPASRRYPPPTETRWHARSDFNLGGFTLPDREMDVMPPRSGPVAAGWYLEQWPFAWPETDWFADPPGTNPPILRYPWGRPGLRLDGGTTDPSRPASDLVGEIVMWNRSGSAAQARQVPNRWTMVSSGSYGDQVMQATFGDPRSDYHHTDASRSKVGSIRISAADEPVIAHRSDGTTETVGANQALPFDLGHCSPLRTIQLLQAADTLPAGETGAIAYRQDRHPSRPWNDAWGHPLVVVYAQFVPERHGSPSQEAQSERDWFVRASHKAYGYGSSIYLAVAAAGPRLDRPLPAPWDDAAVDARTLRDLWIGIRADVGAERWTERAWSDAPWTGVERGGEGRQIRLLTAPIEIR